MSPTSASTRLRRYEYTAVHGIATIRPSTVVISATEMLPASWLGFATPSLRLSVSNAPTIPTTVPSSPSIGATLAISPIASVERCRRETSCWPDSSSADRSSSRPNGEREQRSSAAPITRVMNESCSGAEQ